jgi:macrolide-specific efflux system membrane fusion protein
LTIEDTVSALGNIQPRDHVEVGTQVSGQLRKIHVEIGDRVQAGALLAEIDPTVYQARVSANRAQLDSLKAQRKAGQARLTLAKQKLQRQRDLRHADATSDELVQEAEAELRATSAQIEVITAQIGQVESQLKANEANLAYTRIHAPLGGTVVSISARQGQTVNASQSAPVILKIAELAEVTVQTQVSEADVGRLKIGQEAYFSTLGDPDRRYRGTLRQILPTPEVANNVVLYNALFDVPNPEGRLMTQMTAQVFFVTALAENVLAVPASAVQGGEGKEASVLVALPDGSTQRRRIELGITTRTLVEVKSGLAEGEQVVTGPAALGGAERQGRGQQRQPFRPRLG